MNMTPSSSSLRQSFWSGIITVMLRKTIKHDRAAIAGDMEKPGDVETYRQQFGGRLVLLIQQAG